MRMKENMQIFDWELCDDELEKKKKKNHQYRAFKVCAIEKIIRLKICAIEKIIRLKIASRKENRNVNKDFMYFIYVLYCYKKVRYLVKC